MTEHDGSGEIAQDRPRTFKPNERVNVRGKPGTVLGSHNAEGEYTVFIEGAGAFRLPAADLAPASADPPAQLELDTDVTRRLRMVASQLRDWQARLPAIIRECEALEKAIG